MIEEIEEENIKITKITGARVVVYTFYIYIAQA